ncbi:MAG: type II toxin-antitoxin system Phd/YefM family antitoxin [Deltaproteobacteria bacterium]|nr:type II toxin-antitoxin system Phd/YefM family antitoxin [Deltaproteobacteria bacterium]
MSGIWQLQDAKNRFSEVVDKAIDEGPQTVTRRGEEAVVVIAAREFRDLVRPKTPLAEFFARSPLVKFAVELEKELQKELQRSRDVGRNLKF